MDLRSIIRRYKDEEGTAAIEFGFVAIPFIYMTIAIFELCVFFGAANTLEYALSVSSRMVRTGQLQSSGVTDMQKAFKDDLCTHLYGLIDCSKIGLEAVTMADGNFTTAADNHAKFNADGSFKSQGFDPGAAGSVVLIRVYYKYYMMTPLFGKLFSTQPDQSMPLTSTVVLENEPYTPGSI
ncbi:MAG: tadE-like family protein [Micavibrio sp.]|nr:tadE-like family protein [Micavibrio sp.]